MATAKEFMVSQIMAQRIKAPDMKNAPVFYRNLEARLDSRRKHNRLLLMHTPRDSIDFSSNDFLSLSASGVLREAYLEELARNPDFSIGSTGARLTDGNNTYIESLERDISKFHGAETGIICAGGYDANVAIFSSIPMDGDVVVYDELVHASIHDGLASTRASDKKPFLHNDLVSYREVLNAVYHAHERIQKGERNILVSIESVYSMDGNVAPLKELVRIAKEILPLGNVQFIIDEAHSTGLVGDRGRGLVCAEGLEKEFAIRLHTFSKGLSASGAIILANETVRQTLVNYARGLIYTTAPGFPVIAAARAVYNLLMSGRTVERQNRIQQVLRYFYSNIQGHPIWKAATEAGILAIPSGEGFEQNPLLTQIVPIWTRARDNHHLAAHLHYANMTAWPVDYPVVPKEQGRVRLVLHADNTQAQVDKLIGVIMEWALEMLEVKTTGEMPSCEWMKDVMEWMQKGIISVKL